MRIEFEGRGPRIDPSAWVAPGAVVIGDVDVGAEASIWYGAVVRGDIAPVRIGARTNLQDHVTVHVTGGRHPTIIGDGVTIGHGAIVHGCTVGDGCLIGMGAVAMDGATIGDGSLLAAGSLVAPGTTVGERTLAVGRPARPRRQLTDDELAEIAASAARYVELAARHRAALALRRPAPRPGDCEPGS